MATTEILSDRDYARISSAEYARQFRAMLTHPGQAERRGLIAAPGLSAPARRALGISNAVSAGYLAPVEFSRQIWKAMTASSAVRSVCTVQEGSGNQAVIAFVDDTGNVGRILPEHGAATETDPVVQARRVPTYLLSSDIVRVSFQLAEDLGEEALETFVIETLAERVARLLNQVCTIGAGANSPQGLVTAAVVGVTGATGQTTTVTWDDLTTLKGSVATVYLYGNGQENRGRFMVHRATFEAIQKLKDGDGRPLWEKDDSGKTPGTILNHPVVVNDDMPTMAASAKPILFGDFGTYVIRDAPLVVSVLRERYADYAQIGYHVAARHGAQLIDPAGIRAYQNSAT